MSTVQCVPGGHRIDISDAFWCSKCEFYMCYRHCHHATFTTAISCPKGHPVKKAR